MHEESQVAEILLRRFEHANKDIAEVKTQVVKLTTIVEMGNELQRENLKMFKEQHESIEKRVKTIEHDMWKFKGAIGAVLAIGVSSLISIFALIKEYATKIHQS